MPLLADRVRDTTTTVSNSICTVSGTPPTGFNTFASAFGVGDTFYYAIIAQAGGLWEGGIGTMTNSTSFTRDQVLSGSSGANTWITFSAGTKDVICSMPAFAIDPNNLGLKLALQYNWILP